MHKDLQLFKISKITITHVTIFAIVCRVFGDVRGLLVIQFNVL